MLKIFENTMRILRHSLNSINDSMFNKLLDESVETLKSNNKIIVSGLGKNVPICEKFVGTMISYGLNANFLNSNSAVHGDMGMIHNGDLAIILSKSGTTAETVYLIELLKKRENVNIWVVTFSKNSIVTEMVGLDKTLAIDLEHEGDLWDIVPNNSSLLNLIVLQSLAMEIVKKLDLTLVNDFMPNHPGGAIGELLNGKR